MPRECVTKKERGVYSKKPISSNAKQSSDAPQTKQTKDLIRWIVRDIPQRVCTDEGTLCGQLELTQLIPEILSPQRDCSKISHRYVIKHLIMDTEPSSPSA